MKTLLAALLVFWSVTASAAIDFGGFEKWDFTKWTLENTKVMEIKGVYLDYMAFHDASEPFMLPNVPTSRLDLHLDLEFLNRTLFVDNMVHSETDAAQFALVGWNYRAGIHLTDYVDVYFEHFSQHLLDTTQTNGPEIYDAVGVRIYFYRRKN